MPPPREHDATDSVSRLGPLLPAAFLPTPRADSQMTSKDSPSVSRRLSRADLSLRSSRASRNDSSESVGSASSRRHSNATASGRFSRRSSGFFNSQADRVTEHLKRVSSDGTYNWMVHAKPDTQHPLVFTYSRDELPLKSLDGSTAAKARKILGEYASKALQRLGMQDDNAAVGCRHDGVFVRMVLYLRRGCWEEDDGQLASDVRHALRCKVPVIFTYDAADNWAERESSFSSFFAEVDRVADAGGRPSGDQRGGVCSHGSPTRS